MGTQGWDITLTGKYYLNILELKKTQFSSIFRYSTRNTGILYNFLIIIRAT